MAIIKTNLTHGTTGNLPAVNGSAVTALNASNVASGTLNSARFSGGKIKQVDGVTVTGTRSSNSTSNIATNIYHSITPSATSSKILVIISLPSVYSSKKSRPSRITIRRHTSAQSVNGSELGTQISGDFHLNYVGTNDAQSGRSEYNLLDSPNTTSEMFYQVYYSSHHADNNTYIGQDSTPIAHVTLLEVGA